MSRVHSLKSGAETRAMPGGRCAWICGEEGRGLGFWDLEGAGLRAARL